MSIFSFIMYCFIVTVTPGPTNIIILSAVHNHGVKAAMRFTYGSIFAFFILMVVSTIINQLFISILPTVLIFLQILGTLYMLYLAYKIYNIDVNKANEEDSKSPTTFLSGFLLQFLNPKVVIFTFTVIPSFVLPYYSGVNALSLFVLGITFIAFIAFFIWVLFGALLKDYLQKHSKVTNIVMALFLVYASIMIWI